MYKVKYNYIIVEYREQSQEIKTMMIKIDGCFELDGKNPVFCVDCDKQLQSDECQGYRMKTIRLMFTDNRGTN